MIRISAIGLVLVLAPVTPAFAQGMGARVSRSAHDVFDQVLTPRGEWLQVTPYGRVWRPNVRLVGENFVPYGAGGHWKLTELGWSFESDWDWGWVAFHYGRWAKAPEAGWVWVPGTEWAPAWVDWRVGSGWVGWSALPPDGTDTAQPDAGWTFVRLQHFLLADLAAHAAPRARAAQVHRLTEPARVAVRGRSWYQGPAARWSSPEGEVVVQPARIQPPRRGRIERARMD